MASPSEVVPTRTAGIGSVLTWTVAVLACLWLALCTAVGPLYWKDSSIARFSWLNGFYGVVSFAIYLGIVMLLVRHGRGAGRSRRRRHDTDAAPSGVRRLAVRIATRAIGWRRVLSRAVIHGSDAGWKIMLVLLIGWMWIPLTLVSAFGADVFSQFKEFSWAWNQWTGVQQPYIGFSSFVPMDIYPTYLLKAILAGDIDKMENLGIYEVVEEDFALCEFVDPSKIEMQQIIRDGINLMIKEA